MTKSTKAKALFCLNTQKVYSSYNKLSKEVGCSGWTIGHHINMHGRYVSPKGNIYVLFKGQPTIVSNIEKVKKTVKDCIINSVNNEQYDEVNKLCQVLEMVSKF